MRKRAGEGKNRRKDDFESQPVYRKMMLKKKRDNDERNMCEKSGKCEMSEDERREEEGPDEG